MQTNETLVEHLIQSGVLKTPSLVKAFREVDRVDFVRPENQEEAYGDYPLPIGGDGTISQPTTVAFMLELLEPEVGDKILDVGSGSGWTTALLSTIVGYSGSVIGVELMPELVEFGQENIKKYHFPQSKIVQAKKNVLGWPEKAPYDKILVSATSEKLPQELVDQLKLIGSMVIPIQSSIWKIKKVTRTELEQHEFPGFVFVPLRSHSLYKTTE